MYHTNQYWQEAGPANWAPLTGIKDVMEIHDVAQLCFNSVDEKTSEWLAATTVDMI